MIRSRSPRTIILSLALVIPMLGFAQERREIPPYSVFGDPTQSELSSVEDFLNKYKDAWLRQDTEAYVELHSEDTEWINAYARMFRGKVALANFIEHRLFPAFDSDVSKQEILNMRTISIRYLGDSAVIHAYTDGQRGASRNDGEGFRRTHLHLVLRKDMDSWKVVHTAIMDAR